MGSFLVIFAVKNRMKRAQVFKTLLYLNIIDSVVMFFDRFCAFLYAFLRGIRMAGGRMYAFLPSLLVLGRAWKSDFVAIYVILVLFASLGRRLEVIFCRYLCHSCLLC